MRKTAFLSFAAALVFGVSLGLSPIALAGQTLANSEAVDKIFTKWTTSTPGCAIGVATDGRPVLVTAYGMSDLERDVKNTPETIFEAGSVSKQFTAAAVLLLASDGKLSLDDPARKYLPELPDYGVPLTIRHLLTHTSGLREWDRITAIAGWPRSRRLHTDAHILDVVSRQRALNFTPGTRWHYSNTGYVLAAFIVSRVSGMRFAEFTRLRIFEPLGMTHTSWRDDYRRIVKGRAIAYSENRGAFEADMLADNVHGSGGLLTTVGDLLKWNENFVSPTVGGAALVSDQQRPGRFSDGRAHGYALGLVIGAYKGVPEVNHSGATAGYRAFLARYPDQHVSVALLCNVASASPAAARAVADLYLADRLEPPGSSVPKYVLASTEIDAATGLYRNRQTGAPLNVTRAEGGLQIEPGTALVAVSNSRFRAGSTTWEIDGRGGARSTDAFGTIDVYERVAAAKPTVEQLEELVGTYVSDEAETAVTVAIAGDSLVLKRRLGAPLTLTPIYRDAFSGWSTVIFRRDEAGRPTGFSVVQTGQYALWDLRFERQPHRDR